MLSDVRTETLTTLGRSGQILKVKLVLYAESATSIEMASYNPETRITLTRVDLTAIPDGRVMCCICFEFCYRGICGMDTDHTLECMHRMREA